MGVRLFQVDAFTDRPFAGNPAGVCLLDAPADDRWMQSVATENNLPETAFVIPPDEAGTRGLRWFTPAVEVDLCGHATLATAHVLITEAGVGDEAIAFATRSGVLTARPVSDGIELDLPATAWSPLTDTQRAAAARSAVGAAVDADVVAGGPFVLVVLDSPEAVRACQPDLSAVAAVAPDLGVIVSAATGTHPGSGGPDLVSRMFGPAIGIDEDPVTGAAHCVLGPFWADRLGRTRLRAHQASARGGDLTVEVRGERVALTGRAVTVFRADLLATG